MRKYNSIAVVSATVITAQSIPQNSPSSAAPGVCRRVASNKKPYCMSRYTIVKLASKLLCRLYKTFLHVPMSLFPYGQFIVNFAAPRLHSVEPWSTPRLVACGRVSCAFRKSPYCIPRPVAFIIALDRLRRTVTASNGRHIARSGL